MNSDDISLSPERTSALTTSIERLGDHLFVQGYFSQASARMVYDRFLETSLAFTWFFFISDSPGRCGNAIDARLERCNRQSQNTAHAPTIFRILFHESGITVRGGP